MKAKLTKSLVASLSPADKTYSVRDTEIKGFILRVTPTGCLTYYLDYRIPCGARKSYRIGPAGNLTPAQARDAASKLAAEVVQGVDIQEKKKRARIEAEHAKVRTLRAFLEIKYEPWVVAHRKWGAEAVARVESRFAKLLKEPLDEITQWRIERWRVDRLRAGTAAATVNRDIAALRAVMSKAVEWGVISIHPLAQLKPTRVDGARKIRYLSRDEEERLRTALQQRNTRLRTARVSANQWRLERGYELYPDLSDRFYVDHLEPLVLLSLNTGMRRGELFDLTWGNVDVRHEIVTVVGATAKSGRTRHIPLNDEALAVVKKWKRQPEPSELVFPGRNGERLDNIKTSWAGLLKAAGVTKFRWHDLRHTFASKLVMAGVDLNTVRELLGHADIKMTLRYAHLAPEHKAEAVAKLLSVAI